MSWNLLDSWNDPVLGTPSWEFGVVFLLRDLLCGQELRKDWAVLWGGESPLLNCSSRGLNCWRIVPYIGLDPFRFNDCSPWQFSGCDLF